MAQKEKVDAIQQSGRVSWLFFSIKLKEFLAQPTEGREIDPKVTYFYLERYFCQAAQKTGFHG